MRSASVDAMCWPNVTVTGSLPTGAAHVLSVTGEAPTVDVSNVTRQTVLNRDAIQMLRIDSGKFTLHRERHNLARLVGLSLAEVRAHLDGRVVVNHVPVDLKVDADSELLGLALRQLLDNAAKWSPSGGTVGIRRSRERDRHEREHTAVPRSGRQSSSSKPAGLTIRTSYQKGSDEG